MQNSPGTKDLVVLDKTMSETGEACCDHVTISFYLDHDEHKFADLEKDRLILILISEQVSMIRIEEINKK